MNESAFISSEEQTERMSHIRRSSTFYLQDRYEELLKNYFTHKLGVVKYYEGPLDLEERIQCIIEDLEDYATVLAERIGPKFKFAERFVLNDKDKNKENLDPRK